jgi:hypothetical protein
VITNVASPIKEEWQVNLHGPSESATREAASNAALVGMDCDYVNCNIQRQSRRSDSVVLALYCPLLLQLLLPVPRLLSSLYTSSITSTPACVSCTSTSLTGAVSKGAAAPTLRPYACTPASAHSQQPLLLPCCYFVAAAQDVLRADLPGLVTVEEVRSLEVRSFGRTPAVLQDSCVALLATAHASREKAVAVRQLQSHGPCLQFDDSTATREVQQRV